MSSFIMQYTPIPNKKAAEHQCSFYKSSRKPWRVSGQPNSCTFRWNATPCCTLNMTIQRRSGNYEPPLWDFDFIQSLSSDYKDDRYSKRASMLMVQVKMLLDDQQMVHVRQLELIDDLQRLGISYHFQDKINQILTRMDFEYKNYVAEEKDLYSTALRFRLLRQHGFKVSQEVFDYFKKEEGNFMPNLAHDMAGLLQLYEASFLLTEDEKTLELAREFSTFFLQKKLDDEHEHENVSLLVRRALELPVHWRIQRPNARWFIDAYGRKPHMNSNVLEYAKLDFNIVQATFQEELKHVSRWWEETCLAEKLPFARDRLVECYFWTIGVLFKPQHGYSRIMVTKVIVFLTIIDDIFDVYGTLEELDQFNNALQRWDNVEVMDQLPDYMKICFLALNNLVNETAYYVLKEQGILIVPHLRKSWADLFRAFTQEAKWYSAGYTPKLEEYMKNAWISVTAHVVLSHVFFLITNPIEKEDIESLYEYHNIVKFSAVVFRLANDLGTSQNEMERGDVAKAVECFMNESGDSREDAREYVKRMIRETWKKMNSEKVASDSQFSQDFMRSAVDLGRMAQYMYQHGDGHGIQNPQRISHLLFHPIV